MTEFFKKCGNIPSVAVIFDFSADTEIFFVGSAENIRKYVYDGLPEILPNSIMRQKSKIGYIAKNINRLMGTKYEIDDIVKAADKLCSVEAFCDGTYSSALDELADLYETSDYCNVLKNFIVYSIYCAFMEQRNIFNKKVSITVKANRDRAGKCISDFKNTADKILSPLLSARKKRKFVINKDFLSCENVSDCSTYKVRSDSKTVTINVAHNSYIAFLDMYTDLLSSAGKVIDNCEICDDIFVADRTNYAPVCHRTKCRQAYHTKINTGSREKARENPANDEYIKWDGKCANYRKKLLGMPEQLKKYDMARDKFREKLKKSKKGLTKNSRSEDLENFEQMCFDAAVELQEYSKRLKI